MKKTIKFKKNNKTFEMNLAGFIEAVSFKESSSDLSLPLNHPINIKSGRKVNESGFMGLFQWGEAALYDLGYYLGDKNLSYADLKGSTKNSPLRESWKSQFDSNNWVGKWSGKRDIKSKTDFLNNNLVQYEVINEWINYLCKQIRNNNFNEHFGRIIQNVEITESGAIAGMHLVGIGGLGAFLGLARFKGEKQTDGNGTHIKKYIEDFGNFDLSQCCNRKVYIGLQGANKEVLADKEVTIVSNYIGKSFSGETRVKVKSDENGNLPVIVRHPNTEIKIVADGKESNSIIQKANEKQKATLSDFKVTSHSATLETDSTPQPRPQVNKTPQEVRNEQVQSSATQEVKETSTAKDVKFNIEIVEGDSGKAISNMNFFLTYKGNIKKHTADSRGVKQGIIAEEGQDIEVSVEGGGQKQVIHHFSVSAKLMNQTIQVKLPVHTFNISVTYNGKAIPNQLFTIFYRGREIPKRTNNLGVISVRMLTGFVFGFGIKGKRLVLSRVEKSSATKPFTVNGSAVQASKLYEVADAKRKQAEDLKRQQQQKDVQEKKAKEEAEKAKMEVDQKNQTKQNNTYTESGGKPLTTASNQSPPTSDTTRYHIYHNGKIKRENRAATGYAEFIYYDEKNTAHNLGKSAFNVTNRWSAKGVKGFGSVYLIDQRKHNKYKKGNIGYLWRIDSGDKRYFLSGVALSAVLGAMCSLGYAEYTGSGFSCRDGSPGESVSHLNGENGDFRYIAINNRHMQELTYTNHDHFDWDKNVNFINALYKFGYKLFGSYPVKIKGNALLPHSKKWSKHHNHVHLHSFLPKVEDI